MTTGPVIELRAATKRFRGATGGVHTAVRELTMSVQPGEFVAVVGPTGCGKSTTLSLVSGLEPPSSGVALVRGEPVLGIPDGIGYMFQNDAVQPWRSVLDNVAAGPRYRGMTKAKAREKARAWVDKVGLGTFAGYYPHQLSGGMRKRVALAATLVNEPSILLMDEPFSALDVQTRALMQDELLRLWSGSNADGSTLDPASRSSVIFVTHDLDEAIALADKVIVMTASPATIKASFEVDLPRPRLVEEIRMTPEFQLMYRQIWESLREEVDKARERSVVAG
ncbi:ABC transporter ATP-binding protein [Kutzneria buriramensis]|uniref:NitT/TauT family transport system ATP-binding protein n=1 Tax=Kutzneria buriramensis TaxID=1045776 RepID=A0A3E0I022_9PSEU|nr:ABC transporter ATP-binding protein [Kutzneria buriramensis]REH51981.1 NitT/TauT family transport system ATP-binding protein [Kutzneria buriramensis]